MEETELKAYFYPEELALIKKLEQAIQSYTGHSWTVDKIEDQFYDTPQLRLKQQGIDLRCRKQGDKVILTYKGPIDRSSGFKVREEIEIYISDQYKLKAIFERIGFKLIRVIKKIRKTIYYSDLIITVDYFDKIGYVFEIEGPSEDIQSFANNFPELIQRLGPYSFKDVLQRYRNHKT